MENMRKIFARLQSQSLTLTRADMDHPAKDHREIPVTPHISIDVPGSFASIAEARDYFESIYQICVHHYPRIMQSTPAVEAPNMSTYLIQQYGALFHKWRTALVHFEESRGESLTTKERIGLKLLHIHKNNTMMYYEYARSSEAALFSKETMPFSWDDHNRQFEEIVSLAASVIETSYDASPFNHSNEGRIRPSFSLDNGVVGPLYNVATLCRDPFIRRRAVDLLRSARRQEGIFNSDLCAIVAEKIISIEETAAEKVILDYQSDLLSLESIISNKKLEKPGSEITKSSGIPNTVRLTYAYPKFDIFKKQMFLTIGQSMKADINIPLPAMSFLVDVPN
ncbi:hypothetical protein UA08_06438 [Talaromyces atroroseus]|uniref:Uncharacterized protein n=1 Tax=Talaromyces atroroseus TaxID=1441469 RepID=A0A225AL08_TALAT|nr:hypothetical protein UA08_06438 [Talaromyces atroroseus]OKL57928.1 hypothetical protein UA08_06438 [Talaromyces atroroseus]